MIRRHDLLLRGPRVTLRPFTEADLDVALPWYFDEEILDLSEGNDISPRTTEEIRPIYESLAEQGFLFVIEADGRGIGECCLERMNLEWVTERYPGERVYRLPILIGDKGCWGRGYRTEVVRLLLR